MTTFTDFSPRPALGIDQPVQPCSAHLRPGRPPCNLIRGFDLFQPASPVSPPFRRSLYPPQVARQLSVHGVPTLSLCLAQSFLLQGHVGHTHDGFTPQLRITSKTGARTGCHRSRVGSRKRHENGPLQAVCCHESSLASPRSLRDNSLAHAFPLRGFRWPGWSRYRLRKRCRGRWSSIGYPTKKLSSAEPGWAHSHHWLVGLGVSTSAASTAEHKFLPFQSGVRARHGLSRKVNPQHRPPAPPAQSPPAPRPDPPAPAAPQTPPSPP